jgi:hypothetical protein
MRSPEGGERVVGAAATASLLAGDLRSEDVALGGGLVVGGGNNCWAKTCEEST